MIPRFITLPKRKSFEVKRAGRFGEQDLSGLREFVTDYPAAKAYLLYGGSQRLKFGAIEVLPLEDALKDWLAWIGPPGSSELRINAQ